jgi:hypothetical protein
MMGSFAGHSALGRGRFTPSKPPTSLSISVRSTPNDSEPLPPHELVRKQSEQLAQLKEQYLRLREQFREEQKESSAKLLDLQRELRAEQRRVEELEDEIGRLARTGDSGAGGRPGSVEAIEEIWQLMQAYRDAARPSAGAGAREEEPEFQRAGTPQMGDGSPRASGRRPEERPRRPYKF